MPGCTAPNCNNSSDKGYRLYHFPADKDRKVTWARNIGREDGWTPTKHTCVCEVHFDEDQFESRRADGLRKLKPNAVPTIFNTSIITPRKRRRKVKPRAARRTYRKRPHVIESQDPNAGSEVEDDPAPIIEIWTPDNDEELKQTCVKKKMLKKSTNSEKTSTNSEKTSTNSESDHSVFEALTEIQNRILDDKGLQDLETAEDEVETNCFICNAATKKQVSLNACTKTSKMKLIDKLKEIVSGSVDIQLLETESRALCPRCANVLNYLDRIEMEMNILNKAVIHNMHKRNKENRQLKKLDAATKNKTPACTTQVGAQEKHTNDKSNTISSSLQDEKVLDERNEVPTVTDNNSSTCRICKYKTPYRSLMLFHLRQHLKQNLKRCDFCNDSIKLEDHKFRNKEFEAEIASNNVYVENRSGSGNSEKANFQSCTHVTVIKASRKSSKNNANLALPVKKRTLTKTSEVIPPIPETSPCGPQILNTGDKNKNSNMTTTLISNQRRTSSDSLEQINANLHLPVSQNATGLPTEPVSVETGSENDGVGSSSDFVLAITNEKGEVTYLPANSQLISSNQVSNLHIQEETIPRLVQLPDGSYTIMTDVQNSTIQNIIDDSECSSSQAKQQDVETSAVIVQEILLPDSSSTDVQESNVSTENTAIGNSNTESLPYVNHTVTCNLDDVNDNSQVLNHVDTIGVQDVMQTSELAPAMEHLAQRATSSSFIYELVDDDTQEIMKENNILIRDSVDSQLVEPLNSQITQPFDSQFSEPIDSQLAQSLDSQLTEQIDSQLAQSLDSQLTEQIDSQLAQSLDSQLTEPTDSQVTDSIDTQIAEPLTSQLAQSLDSQLTEPIDSQLTESLDSQLTESIDSQPTQPVLSTSSIDPGIIAQHLDLSSLGLEPNEVIDIIVADGVIVDGSLLQFT